MEVSRQVRRAEARAQAKLQTRSLDRRTKAARNDEVIPPAPVMKRKELGPYFVPLFLHSVVFQKEANLSQREIASIFYYHWVEMTRRCNGRGFRQDAGTSPKRKKPRRGWGPHRNHLSMVLNGLKFIARHGSKEPIHA